MRAMRWLVLAVAIAHALQLPSRDHQGAVARFPVESIAVTGNSNYSREQILAVAGLKVGQIAGPKDFEAARDRLAATGAFEKIEFRFNPSADKKGYAVSFQVVEAGPLFPVRFEELGVPDAELEGHLKKIDPLFGQKIPATEAILARYAKALQELLASKGRKEQVVGKLMAEGAEPLAVVFRPATPPPVVAEVRFLNNQVLPTPALQRAISGVAVGTAYTEKGFRQLLETSIRPLYEAQGHVRVAFPQVRTEQARDVKGVMVTVTVDEGASYELGQVRVDGGPVPPQDLIRAADLKSGGLFNAEQVQAGVERIEKRLRREGYMRVKSGVERRISDERKTVDLAIHLEPGPQYRFGKLRLEGLDIHAEAAVRRLWGLKEGQPFNADYPDYFLERIREDDVFENLGKTRSAVQANDATLAVDVTLYFAERPARALPQP